MRTREQWKTPLIGKMEISREKEGDMDKEKRVGLMRRKGMKKRRKSLAAKTNSSSADENANLLPSLPLPSFHPTLLSPVPSICQRVMCSSQAVSSCSVDVSLSQGPGLD